MPSGDHRTNGGYGFTYGMNEYVRKTSTTMCNIYILYVCLAFWSRGIQHGIDTYGVGFQFFRRPCLLHPIHTMIAHNHKKLIVWLGSVYRLCYTYSGHAYQFLSTVRYSLDFRVFLTRQKQKPTHTTRPICVGECRARD